MLIQNYIAKDFPIYDLSILAKEALFDAQSFEFSHIFVQKNGVFQGAIGKEFLEENQEKTLSELLIYAERFAVLYSNTILDSIKLFHIFNANVVPVINENEEYQGYIAWDSIVCELSKYPLFSEQGALLMVEVARKNYTMMEIAQIVEQNYGKLYGAFINEMNENFVRITMRISNENLTSIGETFERYGYTIIRKFYNDEKEELLKNRYQFMQKYLEY
ncbi:MAG: CBS domain-containing protein [Flavobacteriaceae bacterium]|nr:CBS domain-containing protein [Flavobacteriaceae bacterium]